MGGNIITPTGVSSAVTLDGTAKTGEGQNDPVRQKESRIANLLLGTRSNAFMRRDGQDGPARVTLVEIFFRDREIKHVKEDEPTPFDQLEAAGVIEVGPENMYVYATGDQAGELVTEENRPKKTREYDRPTYPFGRRVLRIGDFILNKDPKDQVWPYRRWPFVINTYQRLPHTWRGLNGVEMVRGMQDLINVSLVHILNYVKNFGDPQVVCEEGALADVDDHDDLNERVASRAGHITLTRKNKLNAIRRDPPPAMSSALPVSHDLFDKNARNLLGMQEVSQGIKSKGATTATEVLRLETNTRMRLTLLTMLLDASTIELMEWTVDLVKRNMSAGQFLKIVGPKQAEIYYTLEASDFDAKFDISLEVGSALPFDEDRKKAEAERLFAQIGEPFLERLLDAFSVPNKEEILVNHQAWMMIQQVVEQTGQMPTPDPVGSTNEPAEETMAAGAGEAPLQEGPA